MPKVSMMVLSFILVFVAVSAVSAEIERGSPKIKDVLPKNENYSWSYWGSIEYGHDMQVTSIIQTDEEVYYSIKGNVYDASGGESEADHTLSLSYIVQPDVLVQVKQEDTMLDSDFDRVELIRVPLEEGNTWTQAVTDENGNEATLTSEITNVAMDNGHYVYTVRYEDPDTLYYEERQIKENTGVVYFEKLILAETGNYEMMYRLNETASGAQQDQNNGNWYMAYVPSVASLDIVAPVEQFDSNKKITVREFLAGTMQSNGYTTDNGSYAEIAANLGIIEQQEFEDYDRPITREEMVKLTIRAIGQESSELGAVPFIDAAEIRKEFGGYVDAAVELGVINGYDDGTFRPDKPASHGEAAKMFYYTVMLHDQNRMTPSDAIALENEMDKRLLPETNGNKVTAFDTKEELVAHAAEIMDERLARGVIENYYREEADDLYVIPKDGITRIFSQHPHQLYMENPHSYYMTQVFDSALSGPYKLTVTYDLVEDTWIIRDRNVESYTGQDISVLDAVHYKVIDAEDLTESEQRTIENKEAQRGYMIFTGETENEATIYASSGKKPTEGYEIRITAIVNQGNTTKVYIEESSPGSDEVLSEVITYPKAIVKAANIQERIEVVSTNGEEMKRLE